MLARFEEVLDQLLQKNSFTEGREPIELLRTAVSDIIQEQELFFFEKQAIVAAHARVNKKIDEIIGKLQFSFLKNALMEVQRRLENVNMLLNQEFFSLNAYNELEAKFVAEVPKFFRGESVLQSEDQQREKMESRLSANSHPALTSSPLDESKKSGESDEYIEFDEEFVVDPKSFQTPSDNAALSESSAFTQSVESEGYIEFDEEFVVAPQSSQKPADGFVLLGESIQSDASADHIEFDDFVVDTHFFSNHALLFNRKSSQTSIAEQSTNNVGEFEELTDKDVVFIGSRRLHSSD